MGALKEAILYNKLNGGVAECTACARRCKLRDGQYGLCGVRWNFEGKLYLAVYGLLAVAHIDPIEKKPLMHFHPGSMVLSLATYGCNWLCQYCQNFDLSQRRRVEGFELSPKDVVKLAKAYGVHGITYTYNEPIIFMEYAHDIGVIAKREGLFNTFVTNGYFTPEAIDYVKDFLDAATVDVKGNADPKFLRKYAAVPDPEPIFQALIELKRKGIFVEITDLVVPKVGDDLKQARKLAKWIVENLGPETPIHFLRFHPDYKMLHLPWTPIEVLEKHIEIAKSEGLEYVYIGNVPGHPYEHTYCPGCGRIVVERYGFDILSWKLDSQNRCKECGTKINIVGGLNPAYKSSRFIPIPIELYAAYKSLPINKLRSYIK